MESRLVSSRFVSYESHGKTREKDRGRRERGNRAAGLAQVAYTATSVQGRASEQRLPVGEKERD